MKIPAEPALARKRHEGDASEEIASTRISRSACLILMIPFLAITGTFAGINLFKMRHEWAGLAKVTATGESTVVPSQEASESWWDHVMSWDGRVMAAIKKVEKSYDEDSPHCKVTQPVVQKLLASLGHGGDDVIIGTDGWLFHRASIRFLTKPWPLEKRSGNTASLAESVEAISAFSSYIKQRGATLVLMPVPPKVSILPEKYGRSLEPGTLMPAAYEEWLRRVRASGALVFDLRPVLETIRQAGTPVFLKTDTHWTAEAMEIAAARMGEFLVREGLVEASGEVKPATTGQAAVNFGDLRRMMRIEETSPMFPRETSIIHPVVFPAESIADAAKKAEVLVMGDSFCNIFSLESLGWGTGSGFADQLGRALGNPVDPVLRNGDGAFATRGILVQSLQSGGMDRLTGKKVVIWEFDATQLTEGTWKSYDYAAVPAVKTEDSGFVEIPSGQSGVFRGTVVSVSPVPTPGTVAYRDYVATIHLTKVTSVSTGGGPVAGTEMLAYGLAMKDNQWTSVAELRAGDSIECTLKSWSDLETDFGPLNRGEPEGDLFLQPVNWLESFTRFTGGSR